jgi:hypothetical protein
VQKLLDGDPLLSPLAAGYRGSKVPGPIQPRSLLASKMSLRGVATNATVLGGLSLNVAFERLPDALALPAAPAASMTSRSPALFDLITSGSAKRSITSSLARLPVETRERCRRATAPRYRISTISTPRHESRD